MKLKQIEMDTVDSMSNEELFDEYGYAMIPDDYDGCMTKHGEVYLDYVYKVIHERLKDWFNEDKR